MNEVRGRAGAMWAASRKSWRGKKRISPVPTNEMGISVGLTLARFAKFPKWRPF